MSMILKTAGGLIIGSILYGFKKLQELKTAIKQIDFKLQKVSDIKIDILKNLALFSANFTVYNRSENSLNIQTIGLVTLKSVLMYDVQNKLIARANVGLTSVNIEKGKSIELKNIPFKTNMSGGLAKVKDYLKDPDSSNLTVVLEFEAFNKIYTTKIN